jgi:hypothetical protein
MAMNMVFSSAELVNAGDSSPQLKTDRDREGSWHEPTRNEVARDRSIRDMVALRQYCHMAVRRLAQPVTS